MNKFLNAMNEATNYTYTENGAVTHKSTMNGLLDLFGMGAAYRCRSESECINLFNDAYIEDPSYALKCLFYIGDCRGGQGERRFFRVVARWLANHDSDAIRRNLIHIPEYRRWDDMFIFIGTPLENEALAIVKHQLALDMQSKTPSLLAKWMPSENTSSKDTVQKARVVRKYLGLTPRQYRKILSVLRQRINIVERLMSENRWNEIEFDKIPSRAGMIYSRAFARHDYERYSQFAKDTSTKVNASVLYPYECVDKALKAMKWDGGDTQRAIANKYWDNLEDYFKNATFNGLAVVDVSGSMCGNSAAAPINVAISIGMYCAEKAKGPFANHFITFSQAPKMVKVKGTDFCDKVWNMSRAGWGYNTNIEATFDMMLDVAKKNNLIAADMPESLIVVSDMEFDAAMTCGPSQSNDPWCYNYKIADETLFESMEKKWKAQGYEFPHIVFWNVQARHNNIAMKDNGHVTYVSGMSPAIFDAILTGKSGLELVMEKLNSERYVVIK